MSRVIVARQPDGPFVEVCSNVCLRGDRAGLRVGLIAHPEVGHGWTELTPDQADALASALVQAARDTRAEAEAKRRGDV